MGFGDELDISKKIKEASIKKQIKVKPIDEKRLHAIEEAKENEPIKKIAFEKQDETEKDIEDIITKKVEFKKETPKYEIFKHENLLLILILIVAVLLLTGTQRLSTFDSQAKDYAKQQIALAAVQQVQKEWPLLSTDEKTKKANEALMTELDKPAVQTQIQDLATGLKNAYRDKNGQTYLLTTDSYYFMNLAKLNVPAIYPGIIRAFHAITPWTLETSTFYLPVLLAIITMTIVYLIVKQITKSTISACISAFGLLLIKEFYVTSSAGDASIVVFMMTISAFAMLLFTYVLDTTNKLKAGLSAIALLGIILFMWPQWNFLIAIIFLFAAVQLIYNTIKNKSVLSFLFAILFGALGIKLSLAIMVKETILPMSMNYLNEYGPITALATIALLGYAVYKTKKLELNKYYTLIIVWFAALLVYSIYSQQYYYLATAPAAIIIGIIANKIIPYLTSTIEQFSITEYNKIASLITITIIFLLASIPTLQSTIIPEMNNQIFSASQYIPDNTTITTWAEQGRYYEYYSNAKAIIPDSYTFAQTILGTDSSKLPENITIVDDSMIDMLPIIKYYAENDTKNDVMSTTASFFSCIEAQNNTIVCKDYLVEPNNMEAHKQGMHPASLTVYSNETKHKDYADSTSDTSLIIMKDKEGYTALIIEKELEQSLLARMFGGDKIEGMTKITEENGLHRVVIYQKN